jgi:hypothetical protein
MLSQHTSMCDPMTSNPSIFTIVFWRRCWSWRQRLATFESVVPRSHAYQVRVRETVPRPAIYLDHGSALMDSLLLRGEQRMSATDELF